MKCCQNCAHHTETTTANNITHPGTVTTSYLPFCMAKNRYVGCLDWCYWYIPENGYGEDDE